MEDIGWMSTRKRQNKSPSDVVSEVIHEYDIINSADHTDSLYHSLDKDKSQSVEEKSVNMDYTQPFVPTGTEDTNKDSVSESSQEDQTDSYSCPRVNCPERIIICLDLSTEMFNETFRSRAGDKWTPLKLVKRALSFFLHSKQRLNKAHAFALVIVTDSATWFKDFTNNIREILSLLDDIKPSFECKTLDLSSVFDVIYDSVDLPVLEGDISILPPPYVVRTLLVLGRSHCHIEMTDKRLFKILESSPYYFTDVLYIHEPASDSNKCEETFDRLCEVDEKGTSYILEASRNPTRLYDQMAQLIAHPLQRPLQSETSYRLLNMADIADSAPT